jgi:hypothetical protein
MKIFFFYEKHCFFKKKIYYDHRSKFQLKKYKSIISPQLYDKFIRIIDFKIYMKTIKK